MTPPLTQDRRDRLAALIAADAARLDVLRRVDALSLPDCWIGAGFVRNAVWDQLHGRDASLSGDVDVVWFDVVQASAERDRSIAAILAASVPAIDWSVKNQARMHVRNGDAAYVSTEDAVRRWPETATAVAVRLRDGAIEVLAPWGLDDLFDLVLRPTPAFTGDKQPIFRQRAVEKRWRERWPLLRSG